MTDRSTIHEASHAVVGRALGDDPYHVVTFGPSSGRTRTASSGDLRVQLVATLAGRAGEVEFGLGIGPRDANPDRRAAFALALELAPRPRHTDAALAEAERILIRSERRAAELVRDYRDAIAEFAATLVANGGRLAGRECREALDGALAGDAGRSGRAQVDAVGLLFANVMAAQSGAAIRRSAAKDVPATGPGRGGAFPAPAGQRASGGRGVSVHGRPAAVPGRS